MQQRPSYRRPTHSQGHKAYASNPRPLSLAIGLGLPLAVTEICFQLTSWPRPWLWLLMANLMLLLLMSKDKHAAGRTGSARTPEATLLALTLLGATPAMLLAKRLFRHKTIKPSFNHALYAIYAIQVVALIYYWHDLPGFLFG